MKRFSLIFIPGRPDRIFNTIQVDRELWATIAKKLRKYGFQVPDDFVKNVILKAYKKRKHLKIVTHEFNEYLVWNFKALLNEYIYEDLHGHSKYRSYRFELDNEKQPVFWYKDNALSTQWLGYQGSTFEGTI